MNGEEVMKASGNKGTAKEELRGRKEGRTTRVHKENNEWERKERNGKTAITVVH